MSQRNVAIKVIEAQMSAAFDMKTAGVSGMDDRINALAQERAKIAAQAYEAGLNDPAFCRGAQDADGNNRRIEWCSSTHDQRDLICE